MKYAKKFGYHLIDGKYYEETSVGGIPTFKKVSEKEIDKLDMLADKIAEKLKDNLDTKMVLKESVMALFKKDINKLHKMLFKSKRKYKAETREHHCVDMKIGNFVLVIVV